MKKVALYARVSSDIQRQERTIESQLFELRKQIAAAGHVLVKEYVDDGHSGADLDRPALEQLRKDLKTPQFDAVYFHSADRIARDVMHQHIIIAELRKYEKQIIIDGRDYVNNPENTFTLTVMGAVAQFERAKIIERTTRGKQHRLRQGYLLGYGHNMYGFTYVKKTPTSPAAYVVNEREAAVVRYIFQTYAKGDVGIIQITRHLESTGVPTREGRRLWHVPQVKYLLKNESDAGIRYFKTERYVKATRTTKYGVTYSYEKRVPRDRSEWIGIKIPAIIPKELFDRVQARIAFNRTSYRNAKREQLLSRLVECGVCGSRCYSYQRYCTKKAMDGSIRVRHKVAYKCNWQASHKMHTDERAERCHNPEVSAAVLEPFVFSLVRDIMLDPSRIRSCMGLFAKARTSELRIERQIDDIDTRLRAIEREKKRIVDIYASGDLPRETYVAKNRGGQAQDAGSGA
jgi:site-specific DNA recombinase